MHAGTVLPGKWLMMLSRAVPRHRRHGVAHGARPPPARQGLGKRDGSARSLPLTRCQTKDRHPGESREPGAGDGKIVLARDLAERDGG
jgi:hypothetical protein